MNQTELHTLGIDIGSTTVKIAVLDSNNDVLFSDYERHFANIQETLSDLLGRAIYKLGQIKVSPMITGSGGLTLAKHLGVPFVQEVVAVSTALQDYAPQTDVAIELGGEDAKIIYFENGNIEQRMNGICAGGTGSFIDQMASLLQTDATGLNEYAKNYKALYTIAARCGVFAKTDIQPLINDGATKEDLSASIFQAVVNQTISGLACGKPIRGHVAFLGGPLHFLSELREAFIRTLKLDDEHIIAPKYSHLFAAVGSALNSKKDVVTSLGEMQKKLDAHIEMDFEVERMQPLFPVKQITMNLRTAMQSIRCRLVILPATAVMPTLESMPVLPPRKPLWSEKTVLFCTPSTMAMTVILLVRPSVRSRIFTASFRKAYRSFTPAQPVTEKRSLKPHFFWMKAKLKLYLTITPLLSSNRM